MSREFKRKTPAKTSSQPHHRWGIKDEDAWQTSTEKHSLPTSVKRLFQGTAAPNVARGFAEGSSKGHDSVISGSPSEDIIASEDEDAVLQKSSFKTPAGARFPSEALAEDTALSHDRTSPEASAVNTQGLRAQRTFISSAFSHQAIGSADHWPDNPCALSGGTLRTQLQKCLQEDKIAHGNRAQSPGKRKPLYQVTCTARKSDGHLIVCWCTPIDGSSKQVLLVIPAESGEDVAVGGKLAVYQPCHCMDMNGVMAVLLPCKNTLYKL